MMMTTIAKRSLFWRLMALGVAAVVASGIVLLTASPASSQSPKSQSTTSPSAKSQSTAPQSATAQSPVTSQLTKPVSFAAHQDYPAGDNPSGVAEGEFNGDGNGDVATANLLSNNVSVLINKGDGTFNNAVNYAVGNGPTGIAAGDFNGDGKDDLAVANFDSGTVSVLINKGDGTFNDAVNYTVGIQPYKVEYAPTYSGSPGDLTFTLYGEGKVGILYGNGDGTFGAFGGVDKYAAGNSPVGLSVNDYNANGRPDVAVTNAADDTVTVLYDDWVTTKETLTVGTNPIDITSGFLASAPSYPSLAVANQNSNDVTVLLGKADWEKKSYPSGTGTTTPSGVTIAPLNRDSINDIAVSNLSADNVGVLLGKSDGTFETAKTFAVGDGPGDIAQGQLNKAADQAAKKGDRVDLVTANEISNNVSVLLNTST
jgi:hypothetical protein